MQKHPIIKKDVTDFQSEVLRSKEISVQATFTSLLMWMDYDRDLICIELIGLASLFQP